MSHSWSFRDCSTVGAGSFANVDRIFIKLFLIAAQMLRRAARRWVSMGLTPNRGNRRAATIDLCVGHRAELAEILKIAGTIAAVASAAEDLAECTWVSAASLSSVS